MQRTLRRGHQLACASPYKASTLMAYSQLIHASSSYHVRLWNSLESNVRVNLAYVCLGK